MDRRGANTLEGRGWGVGVGGSRRVTVAEPFCLANAPLSSAAKQPKTTLVCPLDTQVETLRASTESGLVGTRKSVERSLDAANRSVCATHKQEAESWLI